MTVFYFLRHGLDNNNTVIHNDYIYCCPMNFSNIMACTLIDNVAKIIDTSQYVTVITHMHHLAGISKNKNACTSYILFSLTLWTCKQVLTITECHAIATQSLISFSDDIMYLQGHVCSNIVGIS